jgi:hypothetical protein
VTRAVKFSAVSKVTQSWNFNCTNLRNFQHTLNLTVQLKLYVCGAPNGCAPNCRRLVHVKSPSTDPGSAKCDTCALSTSRARDLPCKMPLTPPPGFQCQLFYKTRIPGSPSSGNNFAGFICNGGAWETQWRKIHGHGRDPGRIRSPDSSISCATDYTDFKCLCFHESW